MNDTTVADLVLTEHIGKQIAVQDARFQYANEGVLVNLMSVQEWPRFRKGPDDSRVVVECHEVGNPDCGWHMPFALTDKVTFLDEGQR